MAAHGVGIVGLARELGLSKSTVSRALNDYPDIAEGTKRRVRTVAQARGYRPSSAARRLTRGRVDSVGVVLSDPGLHLTTPHLSAFLSGMALALDGHGLDLVVATAPAPDRWAEVYDRLLDGRRVDGFVVLRTEADDARVRHLRARGAHFVTHGRTAAGGPFPWLDVDSAAAAEEATLRLAAMGHRRVAHLAAPARYMFARHRREGFLRGAAEAGLDDASTVEAGLDAEGGRRATMALMAAAHPPTALVACTDVVALGALRALRELGLRAGREVSVIGYDDVPAAAEADPPLTTFDQGSVAAGQDCAELLARLLAGASASALQVLRRARLRPRASDGPPALTSAALRARLDRTQPQSMGRDA